MAAFDNSSTANAPGSAAAMVAPLTIAAQGQDRVLVIYSIGVGPSNAQTKVSSPQFDGVAPTFSLTPDVEFLAGGIDFSVQCFVWLEGDLPANGSPASFDATGTSAVGAFDLEFLLISATSGKQLTPEAVGRNSDTTAQSSSTVAITSLTDNALLVEAMFLFPLAAVAAPTATAGQTERSVTTFGPTNWICGGTELIATAGLNTQTWSWLVNLSDGYGSFAVSIADVAAQSPITVESTTLGDGGAGGFSHTLTGNANRGVIVEVNDESTTQATGVDYDGVAMTLVETALSTDGLGNASTHWVIFEDQLPGSGSFTVEVFGLSASAGAAVTEISNVDPVVPSGSAIDENDVLAVATISTTATAPAGFSLAIGMASHGAFTAWDEPPSGTGTWTRRYVTDDPTPPVSAIMGGAFQQLTGAGAITYTETSAVAWNRATMIQVIYTAFTAAAVPANTFFAHGF